METAPNLAGYSLEDKIMDDAKAMEIALGEAQVSYEEGGIPVSGPKLKRDGASIRHWPSPKDLKDWLQEATLLTCSIQIGAVLVASDGNVLGKGHNLRVQLGSPIHHVSSPIRGRLSSHHRG